MVNENYTGTGQGGLSGVMPRNASYATSFFDTPDTTTYVDLLGNVDIREQYKSKIGELVERKALDSQAGGAGTAGYAMIPVNVDTRLIDDSRKYTPLVELIPRVTNMGTTFDYNKITSKGSAGTNIEDPALSEADDTQDRYSVNIQRLYSVGRVTGFANAAMPAYQLEDFQPSGSGLQGSGFSNVGAPNGFQKEVATKFRSLKEREEGLIINGNKTTSNYSNDPDGTEFDGLIQLQSTTNQNDVDDYVSFDVIEDTNRLAYDDSGRPNVIVGGSSVITDVRKAVRDQIRYAGGSPQEVLNVNVPSGLVIDLMQGPAVAIPSQFLSNTTGAKQLWFLDMNTIEMRVLQDATYEKLAQNGDSQKFMIKEYLALANRSPQRCAYADDLT